MTTEPELEATAAIAQQLIRFDTSNYGEGVSNGETDAAEYLGSLLENLGLKTTYVDSDPGRTSVVARVEGSDELVVDETEIEEAHWFTRDQLRAGEGPAALPPPVSIARHIIDRWLAGELD